MNRNRSDHNTAESRKNYGEEVWNFVSAPALKPMKVTINTGKPGTAPGLLFTAPYTSYDAEMIGQTGSLIMDQEGNPVWFKPLSSRYTQNTDFRMQYYKGKPVLTMWQGTISGTQSDNSNLPDGDPEPGAYYQILNQNYKIIKELYAQEGFTSDVHEFTITERNTALFTAIRQEPVDLTPYGGPADGYFDNCSIQEIDLETGELIFFWNGLDHINPADSMVPASSAVDTNNIWDCYHINSVEEGPDNTLLISMRNMWAIYNIDKETGNIIWQLGGKKSDFTFGPDAGFSWQHDARYRAHNRISLFDDACCASFSGGQGYPARGLILVLDYRHMTANVDRTYYHNPLLTVASQGNMQQLCNGNQLIGWGQEPYLSEFANGGNTIENPSINLLFDMQYPNENISYRAFKDKWEGYPNYPPSIAVRKFYDRVTVFASWNGSTETAAWQVLAGRYCDCLETVVPYTPRTGFETEININSEGPYFQVNALNSCGEIIGESQITRLRVLD